LARILQTVVPPIFPSNGKINAIIYGEAPGPRGADKTGIPFFGDACGKLLYQTLYENGMLLIKPRQTENLRAVDEVRWCNKLVEGLWVNWNNGETLRDMLKDFSFELREVALSNSYDRCPTSDGEKFRKPFREELESDENKNRIRGEIDQLDKGTRILALGCSAKAILTRLGYNEIIYVPHPSQRNLARYGLNGRKVWKEQFLSALIPQRPVGNHPLSL
jgi:hypothetical protein